MCCNRVHEHLKGAGVFTTPRFARRHDIIRAVVVATLTLILSAPATAQFKPLEKLKPKKRVWCVLTAMSLAAAATDIHNTIQSKNDGVIWESDPLIRPFNNLPDPAYATLGMTATGGLDFVCLKMQSSRHVWIQKIWWVPQVVQIGLSIWGANGSAKY